MVTLLPVGRRVLVYIRAISVLHSDCICICCPAKDTKIQVPAKNKSICCWQLRSIGASWQRQQLPTFVFDKKKAQKRNLSVSVCVCCSLCVCVCVWDNPQSTASTPSTMSAVAGTVTLNNEDFCNMLLILILILCLWIKLKNSRSFQATMLKRILLL